MTLGRHIHVLFRRPALDAFVRVTLHDIVLLSAGGAFVKNFRPIIYCKTAKENHERGIRSLKGDCSLDAVTYFNHLRQNWPTSRWVAWAELGLADFEFGCEA